jgi:hypothetical protein
MRQSWKYQFPKTTDYSLKLAEFLKKNEELIVPEKQLDTERATEEDHVLFYFKSLLAHIKSPSCQEEFGCTRNVKNQQFRKWKKWKSPHVFSLFDGQDMWHVWGRGEVHTGL